MTPVAHQIRLPGRDWTCCDAHVAEEQAARGVETRALVDAREVSDALERIDIYAHDMMFETWGAGAHKVCTALRTIRTAIANERAALTQEPTP